MVIIMDQIRISDLKIYAHHGVFDFEKEKGQNFYVNATLFLNLQKAGRSDRLETSVNYAAVCDDIVMIMKEKSYDLIEAVAEQICIGLLNKYSQIEAVELELKKPEAPLEVSFSSVSVCIHRQRHKVYVAFGANEGDCLSQIQNGLEAISDSDWCKVKKVSEIIKSSPYGGVEQNDFYNGVLEMETYFEPEELLDFLQEIEKVQGRVRKIHWGPRTLDLDILLYDNLVYDSECLTIPHRDMVNRDFVMEPLASIAPYYRHPLAGKTISEMLDGIKEKHIL